MVIRIRKSKKDRQRNGQKKTAKKTNNDLEYTTQKTKAGYTVCTTFLSLFRMNRTKNCDQSL